MRDPSRSASLIVMPRKLRIAVSVFFGLLTVALCVLYASSDWRSERIVCSYAPKHYAMLETIAGHIYLHVRFTGLDSTPPSNPKTFIFRSRPPTHEDLAASTNPLMRAGFGAWYSADFKYLAAPYWFAASSTGMIAAVAFLPWTSHRFSLRTLLIATTLVAVVLGGVVWVT